MFGETLTIIHLVMIEMQNVTNNFLYNLRSWRFRFVIVLIFKLLTLCFGCSNQGILTKVSLLEFLYGTLTLAFLASELVAVSYHAVSLG